THSPLQREQLDYVSARSSTLTGMFGERYLEAALNTPQGNRKVNAELVGGSYFTTVGVGAALGRVFTAAEDSSAASSAVAVISHRWWREGFGADPSVVGRTLRINGQPITVVGVAREGFAGAFAGFGPQIWIPLAQMGPLTGTPIGRYNGSLYVGGRLRDGVTADAARAELRLLAAQLTRQDPAAGRDPVTFSMDGSSGVTVELRQKFGMFAVALLAVTGLVLLIACSNVANLLLARGVARRREMGVRMAVGAARGRLVRQLLTEAVLLALAGAGAAVLATCALTSFAVSRIPPEIPMALRLSPDVRVLAFALGGALVAALLFGVAPALRTASADVVTAIKEGSVAPRGARLRNTLVGAQVALCMVLLGSSALFLRSLGAAGNIDPGFDPAHVLNQSVDLRLGSYDETTGPLFYQRLQSAVRGLPGVQSVALQHSIPLQGESRETRVVLPGEGEDAPGHATHFNTVGAGFFRTMGVPVLRGREFTATDRAGAPLVVVVNETFVRRHLGGGGVGSRLSLEGPNGPFATVVGVVRDGKYVGLGEDPLPMLYQAFGQSYDPEMTLHVRTSGDPAALAAAVRRETAALDPALPLPAPRTMKDQLRRALLPAQLGAAVLGGMGALALVLAAVGIYGVVSFAARQRTREMGIRAALGAPRLAVVKMVMGANLRVVGVGLAVGTVLALITGRLVSGMLYGVAPADPALLVGAPAVLMSVALLASYLPARRAARVDPMVALRSE
ncbi:MAG TPA: ABC transporter permease, partial [Longimicrobium sp.]